MCLPSCTSLDIAPVLMDMRCVVGNCVLMYFLERYGKLSMNMEQTWYLVGMTTIMRDLHHRMQTGT
jgi:hypothetical protein